LCTHELEPDAPGRALHHGDAAGAGPGADEKTLTAVAIAALSVFPRMVPGPFFRPGV
jgi:hypothetical protein